MIVAGGSNVSLSSSCIGGQGKGRARVDVGLMVAGDATISLGDCGVTMCSSFGVKAHDSARISWESGSVSQCRVGLMLGEEAEVRMRGSEVVGGDDGAAFYVEDRARYTAKLFLTDTWVPNAPQSARRDTRCAALGSSPGRIMLW